KRSPVPKIDSEKFYTSAIEMFGTTARGVNWASKKNQELRFDAILKLLPDDLSSFSIADAGCGFGDFYLYLEKKKRLPKRYIGIDSVLEMYSIASQNTAQEILNTDICRDPLPNADYYICSGALNVLTPFETQLFVQNCYNSSRKAFIFNALYGDTVSETYNYLTQKSIDEMVFNLKVASITTEDKYMPDDITVGFFR
ncbi:MAG: class I SAM-dependent methyltransferase, partial [Campylobacterota bacterium]|nr:class I SAM-dependent methyltransferase [Campylobacterota bacterium]